MKQFFTLLFSFVTTIAVAQPILNGNAPQPGNVFALKKADTTNVQPGSAGMNQNWNFNLSFIGDSSLVFSDAASTPYAAQFPGANVAVTSDNATYSYFISNDTMYALVGVGSATYNESFSDPRVVRTFPFLYNDAFTDSFTSTFSFLSWNGVSSGWNTNVYDAFGTLTVNGVTYDNVIRIHTAYAATPVVNGNNTDNFNDIYTWFFSGDPQPLMVITNSTVNGVTTKSVLAAGQTNSLTQTIESLQRILSVNKKNQNLEILLSQSSDKFVDVSVFNVIGQPLLSQRCSVQSGFVELYVPLLAAGIYLLRVETTDGNVMSKKFLVK